MTKPYIYHRLEPGKYVCCTCGSIHDGPCPRQDAITCCRHLRKEKVPVSLKTQHLPRTEARWDDYSDRLERDIEDEKARPRKRTGGPSPLQALAYAFQTHNWQAVKNAAYALAEHEALLSQIRRRYQVLDDFDQALDELAADADLDSLGITDAENGDVPESEL